ncbi:O-antigen ligase family protein [Acidimicrobiia bacterium EGI L10123]|uniref:O-antigen ligase family protein n=1 Tax=Salinilacustrithrix flava TaxID=2957203 RepID=UPI003D7C1AB2|nr:O-antigen ligase family protein [Acidimicrobiia bacterium EGI L10123]
MTVLAVLALATGWYVTRSFDTKVLVLVAVLPFLGWLQAHAAGVPWSLAVTGLIALLLLHAVRERPASTGRGAHGLTALVLGYGAVVAAQAFSTDLPSVLTGLRGARLVVEALALYFIGAEVARRPVLVRRLVQVVLAGGALVGAYAIKQWLAGFDAAEIAHYRRTFPIAIRERRIFSTLPGASALGHHLGLVALMSGAALLVRPRRWVVPSALLATSLLGVLLTGQRGVQLSVFAAGLAVVAVALCRPAFRREGARAGQVVTVLATAVIALVLLTPVQDRRAASEPDRSAFDSARIKLALLRDGADESSARLRTERLGQTVDALLERPFGAGTGLNLLVDPERSARSTFLGQAGFGDETYRLPLDPLPGESYYYTLASETGLPGLAGWLAISWFGIASAAGIALRHPDRTKAAVALAACGYLVIVVVDSFTVDAMSSITVSGWFWLLVGMVGRWAHEDRLPRGGEVTAASRPDGLQVTR